MCVTLYYWNPYQWYKGAIGQYVYAPNAISKAQRLSELRRFAIITGAGLSVPSSMLGVDAVTNKKDSLIYQILTKNINEN